MLSLGLVLIATLSLSCFAGTYFEIQQTVLAQSNVQTIKYRNLVIDLGSGVKTNAQLTLPAIGKGPFFASYMSFMSPSVTSIRGNRRTCRLRSIFTNKYEGFCGTL